MSIYKMVKFHTYLSGLAGFCILSIVSGCGHSGHHHEGKGKFAVTSPLKQTTTLTRDYVCQIHSIRHIELRALEKGYLEEIFVDEGQYVHKGDMLFQVVPRMYRAELDRAQAEYDAAKIEYENTEKLKQKNIVATSELNLAKAKLDKAQAELSLAEVHLDFTKIKAPFNGITGRLHVREGSLIEEGELLSTLSDNDEMWVYFNVPEVEYLEYKNDPRHEHDADVKLLMANNQPYARKGKITAIEADFNNETGNIAFRATFPNPDKLLRHGQTGTVLLETPVHDAMLIPQKATFEILDKRYVYTVDKDNKIVSKQISVVAELPDVFVVGDELSEKDTILLEGLRKVRDGDTITPRKEKPAAVLASLRVYAE